MIGVAGGEASREPIADERGIGYIGGTRQKPIPPPALRETREPLVLETASDRLAFARTQKGVDGRVKLLARCQPQVAAQPGGQQIIIDRVGLERGRVRRL